MENINCAAHDCIFGHPGGMSVGTCKCLEFWIPNAAYEDKGDNGEVRKRYREFKRDLRDRILKMRDRIKKLEEERDRRGGDYPGCIGNF